MRDWLLHQVFEEHKYCWKCASNVQKNSFQLLFHLYPNKFIPKVIAEKLRYSRIKEYSNFRCDFYPLSCRMPLDSIAYSMSPSFTPFDVLKWFPSPAPAKFDWNWLNVMASIIDWFYARCCNAWSTKKINTNAFYHSIIGQLMKKM